VSGDAELVLPPPGPGVDGARLEINTRSGEVRGSLRGGHGSVPEADGERRLEADAPVALVETLGNVPAVDTPAGTEPGEGSGRIVVSTVSGDIAVRQE
jgi:DUF4097 and DUF4098 domain-containing protein YvlB